jgi:hypothetical protein
LELFDPGCDHTASCNAIETGHRPFECIEKVANEIDPAIKIPPKVADSPSVATIPRKISLLILHCCNTWPAIAEQTLLEMWSSLVIRFTDDQD